MKRLLSLFDYSGNWSSPFAKNGWEVINWDIKLSEFMDINLLTDAETVLDMFEDVDGILAGVPCTEFASSGARWWKEKDSRGDTKLALELAHQTQRIIDLFTPTDPDYDGVFFWAIENPVGRLGSLIGLENPYYFDPYEFAGYMDVSNADFEELGRIRAKDGIGISKQEAELILKTNAYTKKTCLWGEFNRNLEKKPIAPIKGSTFGTPLMRLGGKSARTKEVRSVTPQGFAEAFYEANKNHVYSTESVSQPSFF